MDRKIYIVFISVILVALFFILFQQCGADGETVLPDDKPTTVKATIKKTPPPVKPKPVRIEVEKTIEKKPVKPRKKTKPIVKRRAVADFYIQSQIGTESMEDTYVVNVGERVTFINKSTGTSRLSWNFGDNSPSSSLSQPAHHYATSGTYIATLTINDNPALTKRKTIIVNGGYPEEKETYVYNAPPPLPPPVVHIVDLKAQNERKIKEYLNRIINRDWNAYYSIKTKVADENITVTVLKNNNTNQFKLYNYCKNLDISEIDRTITKVEITEEQNGKITGLIIHEQ